MRPARNGSASGGTEAATRTNLKDEVMMAQGRASVNGGTYPSGPWIPDVEAVPVELREANRWVRWKLVPQPGSPKPKKVPLLVDASFTASSTDPSTWGTFTVARANGAKKPSCGIGFCLGRNGTRGYVGVDLDGVRDAETGELAAEAEEVVRRCATYTEVSPSGAGIKLIGTMPVDAPTVLPRNKADLDDGGEIEVYAHGRYFTLTGQRLDGSPDTLGDLSEALPWLASRYLTRPPATPSTAAAGPVDEEDEDATDGIVRRAAAYLAKCDPAVSGENGSIKTLVVAEHMVRGFRLSERQALALLLRDYNPRCLPPWDEPDLSRKVHEARTKGKLPFGYLLDVPPPTPSTPPPTPPTPREDPAHVTRALTETGNAERLVDLFGGDLRWCSAFTWLAWDGKRWARDDRKRAMAMAKVTVRRIYSEAAAAPTDDQRRDLAKWAQRSETRAAREAMVSLAAAENGIPIGVGDLDRDPWALNLVNGTLDLRSGKLRQHERGDLLTKLAPVVFAPEATAPTWHAFLERILPDEEVRAFVQRFIGYAATGLVREHVLPIFYGTGANGKSTAIEAVRHVLGDYAVQANPMLLMAKTNETHPTERATLLGRRLATCSETEDGRSLSEAMVKQLTGGDEISARYMRCDEFNFAPTHKLVMCTNHMPRVSGTDLGIWRRLMLVPFTVTIPEDERDVELGEKLRAEAPGILRWIADGCRAWQAVGLNPPAAVRLATDEYRKSEDVLADFFFDRCHVSPSATDTVRVKAGDLFGAYRKWCEDTGNTPMSQRSFGLGMTERGFKKTTHRAPTFYLGIRLTSSETERATSGGGV